MDSLKVLVAACLAASSVFGAGNLVGNGDFAADAAKVGSDYRAFGGTFEVFTETPSWNRCGKFTLGPASTDKDGTVTTMGFVYCGFDATAKTCGFPAEPETTYVFSFETKGDVPGLGISVAEWSGDDFDRDLRRIETSVRGVKPNADGWTLVKGTFRTTAAAKRVALRVGLYASTRYKMTLIPEGTTFLVDNVKITKAQDRLAGPAPKETSVAVRKAVAARTADPERISDFKTVRAKTPDVPTTSVTLLAARTGLVVDLDFVSPDGVAAGTKEKVWSGESAEVLFGHATDAHRVVQFAFNPSGAKFLGDSREAVPGNERWTLRTQVRADGWTAHLEIPYDLLGLGKGPKKGGTLPFNVSREVPSRKGWYVWSPVRNGNGERERFGTLVFGSYADAFKARWGRELGADDRATFERATAEAVSAAERAKFEKFKAGKFSVAPVSVTSDFGVPFLPDEVFDPPKEIRLVAAVNEVKALPLALANLTDKTAQYRVIVETEPPAKKDDGDLGLAGFPPEQVTCRVAARIKDSDSDPVAIRLDPLVKADEIQSVTVPAKEAGLVWFDFDTTDVKPGVYRGRVRVLPLEEPGEWKQVGGYQDRAYVGVGRSVPLTLEVLPVELPKDPARPTMLCDNADTESAYRLMRALGNREFAVSPWYFQFERLPNGDLDLTRPKEAVGKARDVIRRHQAYAAKYGDPRPHFLVMYSTWNACMSLYNGGKADETAFRLWPQYLKGVKQVMNAAGVPDGEYAIEAWDEPPNAIADTVIRALQIAREAIPTMQLQLSLGCQPQHGFDAANFKRALPYVDQWMNWRYGFFDHEFLPVTEEAKRRGASVQHYSCGTSMREPIYFTYRLMPWFGELHGLAVDGLYQFSNGAGGSGRSSFKATTYGEIVYRSFDTFVPSVRYMAIREGQTDIRYLAALRKLRGDDSEVLKFLAEAPVKAVRNDPNNAAVAPQLRAEALNLILKGKH